MKGLQALARKPFPRPDEYRHDEAVRMLDLLGSRERERNSEVGGSAYVMGVAGCHNMSLEVTGCQPCSTHSDRARGSETPRGGGKRVYGHKGSLGHTISRDVFPCPYLSGHQTPCDVTG
jgi:hypothetical protein